MVSANATRGISPRSRGVSRAGGISGEEGTNGGLRASPRRCGQRIELNGAGPNDHPGARVRQAQVKPGRLPANGRLVGEVDERRRRPTPSPHARSHRHALRSERPGELDALGILSLDDDSVSVQGVRETRRCTRQHQCQNHTRRHGGAYCHCTNRRAPTHRAIHQDPSGSFPSSRDSFTPVLELWMKVCWPTYMPTCVTPPPG